MRIVCPACETAYDVPDQVASAGRSVRCARCRAEWVPEPLEVAEPADLLEPAQPQQPEPVPKPVAAEGAVPPAPPIIAAPAPVPVPPAAPIASPAGSSKAVIAAWAASFVLLIVMAGAAIAYRQPIMRNWPASARAYALLGYK